MRNSSFDMSKMSREDAKKLLFQVQEFITTELSFIDKMSQLEIAIQSKSHESKLSKTDQGLCEDSLHNCRRIIDAKDAFRHEFIHLLDHVARLINASSPQSVTSVSHDMSTDDAEHAVHALVAIYSRPSYQDYCQAIMDAVPNFSKLSTLMQDDKLGICSLLITATQRIPRHRLFFEALEKKYDSHEVNSALKLSEKNGLYLNKTVSLDAVDQALAGRNIRAKKEIGLGLILKLQLNSFTANEEAKQHYSSDFLQSVLIQAYPHKFGSRDGQFISLGKDQLLIDAALGLPTVTLEPHQFDAEALDALWMKTKKPIWRVLKSTKPIDHHFSMLQKLQSYQQVIECIQQGTLGKKDKVALMWEEASNMMRILQTQPPQEFSEELLSTLITLNRQLENLSSMTMFERLQRFIPLFHSEMTLTTEQKKLLSDLHHLIAEQEEKRPLSHAMPHHRKMQAFREPLDEQTIFKPVMKQKPQVKKSYKIVPEPIISLVKPLKGPLNIDDIDLDMDTDDNSTPHE